jgi:hypothetical protein
LHGDDVLAPSHHTGHFDGSLDRLRTGVPEEERVQRFVRHDGKQLLDKLKIWLVECDTALCRTSEKVECVVTTRAYLAMHKVHALLCCSSANLRVTVTYIPVSLWSWLSASEAQTENRNADTGGEVEHLPSVCEMEVRAFALVHEALGHSRETLGDMRLSKVDQ